MHAAKCSDSAAFSLFLSLPTPFSLCLSDAHEVQPRLCYPVASCSIAACFDTLRSLPVGGLIHLETCLKIKFRFETVMEPYQTLAAYDMKPYPPYLKCLICPFKTLSPEALDGHNKSGHHVSRTKKHILAFSV